MEITQYRLAKDINVPPRRINEIVHGKRGITADTALRLSAYFKTSPEFWAKLQMHYDMDLAKQKIAKTHKNIRPCAWLSQNQLKLKTV